VSGEITLSAGLHAAFDQRQRHQFPVAREHNVGVGKLRQADRDAVSIGHGGLLDRTPAAVMAQLAARGARKLQLRRLAEPDALIQLPKSLGRQAEGELGRPHVGRLLEDLRHAHGRRRMDIADGVAGERQRAG